MLASVVTVEAILRSSRYLTSLAGRLISGPFRDARLGAWIDMRRCREEAFSITDLDYIRFLDLSILPPWHHLEQVPVCADRRRWDVPKLGPGHLSLRHGVMHSVDLNLKLPRTRLLFLGCGLSHLSPHWVA